MIHRRNLLNRNTRRPLRVPGRAFSRANESRSRFARRAHARNLNEDQNIIVTGLIDMAIKRFFDKWTEEMFVKDHVCIEDLKDGWEEFIETGNCKCPKFKMFLSELCKFCDNWDRRVKGQDARYFVDKMSDSLDKMLKSNLHYCNENCGGSKRGRSIKEDESLKDKANRQKEQDKVDEIINSIKNTDLDKASAKKYTNKLSKLKQLKGLKNVKNLIAKLSKLYPEAKELLTESNMFKYIKAVRERRNYINENLVINGYKVSTYSLKELKEAYAKTENNLKSIKKMAATKTLNESINDLKELKAIYKKQKRLLNLLNEEIGYKEAILNIGLPSLSESDKDEKKESNKDDAEFSLDAMFNDIENSVDDAEEKEEKDDSKGKKKESEEDEDEVELDSITITLASEDAANELKDALVDKGVPESAIEIEEVSDEEDEEDEDGEEANEAYKFSNKFRRLFEDDEALDEDEEADTDDDSEEDADDDSKEDTDDSEEAEDKQFTLTLTDTDYIDDLKDIMCDEYGYDEDEFWDAIGGEPVEDDEEDEDKEDEDKEDDEDNSLETLGPDIFAEE